MGFALSDLRVSSPAFEHGAMIPARHTGEGEDVSPALVWDTVPEGTRSFAVICHDPDAPLVSVRGTYGFVHWVLYDIPGTERGLPEAAAGFSMGRNDFGKLGYGGPMPPPGHGVHHYYFWVLALRHAPQLESGLTLWDLLHRIEPSIIGMNRLIGTFLRE